ncbi:hypothetical protein DXX93_10350 [Thalassotalea euphylliae]|uniref:Uncharacterized protein n=1 Tax=Thalassotalea euphylliae TaxID=1655234 RepID=A0A3E0TRE0_9GAMM|nr:hypothetical protein [Thalassotalea euphylliae]REL26930.1 hypothetical protein DXX93_10350 [Thalassotalea euphylliae]
MKSILKALWHDKRVTVSINEFYIIDGFNRCFRMKICVESTCLLPSKFTRGATHIANMDIVETLGGLPRYVAKILDDTARQEHTRRTKPIVQQLRLF